MTLLMNLPIPVKLGLSIILDALDFVAFIPFGGIIFDLIQTGMAYLLWGHTGALAVVEVILPNQIDAFIPSVTITGLISMGVIPLPV